jgi:hypothetical protein
MHLSWYLTRKEEGLVSAVEIKALRRIFGPVKDGEVGKYVITENYMNCLENQILE